MTASLHIQAQADAPIACDMSTAQDTPNERLSAYTRLFESALMRRERRDDAVVLWFRADAGTRDAVDELARREAACCPFLDYHVETIDNEVIWTISHASTGDRRASVAVILDATYALTDHAYSNLDSHLEGLTDRGIHITETGDGFELRE